MKRLIIVMIILLLISGCYAGDEEAVNIVLDALLYQHRQQE